jgi:hypothetical protein
VTRRDQIRNNVIRERLRIKPKWFAPLERMPCDSIPYKSYIREEKKKEEF